MSGDQSVEFIKIMKIVIIQNTFYHFETGVSLYQTLLNMGLDVCFYMCSKVKEKNRFQQLEFLNHYRIKVYNADEIPENATGVVVSTYSNPKDVVPNIDDEIFSKISKRIYISHRIDHGMNSTVITKNNTLCLSPISERRGISYFNLLDFPDKPIRKAIDKNINICIQGHFQHGHRDVDLLNCIKPNDKSYKINLLGTCSEKFLANIEYTNSYQAFDNLSELDFHSICNNSHFFMPLIDCETQEHRYINTSYSSTFIVSSIFEKPIFADECFQSMYKLPGIYYNKNNFVEQFEKMVSISSDDYTRLTNEFKKYKNDNGKHNAIVISELLNNLNAAETIENFYKYNKLDASFNADVYSNSHPETKTFYQPHCENSNINDIYRLFYHYMLYTFPCESQDILSFYKHNEVDKDFDHWFYREHYPQTENFLIKFCRDNLISDRERLFYHYIFYGKNKDLKPNINGIKSLSSLLQQNLKIQKIKDLEFLHIDEFLPPHRDYVDQYNQRIKIGKEIAAQSKIAIVSLARNCDNLLLKSIENIEGLECKESKIFIFENDSTDETKNAINTISRRYSNVYFKSIDNGEEYLQDRSRKRTNALAEYRNECQDWVKNNCSNYNYVIVLDLDADLGFSLDGVYNSIGWFKDLRNAGGVASYSLLFRHLWSHTIFSHYDTFACRLNDWSPTPEDNDQNSAWMKNVHPLIGSEPFHLYSCFGGLAIYKMEAFLSGRYDCKLGSEHVKFHKDLHDNGYKMYLNPSSRFFSTYESYLK